MEETKLVRANECTFLEYSTSELRYSYLALRPNNAYTMAQIHDVVLSNSLIKWTRKTSLAAQTEG